MLLLIDGSAILHRMYHAHSDLCRSDGLPVGALYGFSNALWGVRKADPQPDQILVAWDGKRCFRHDLSPTYKANRSVKEADLAFQLSTARECVAAFGINQLEVEGFEADDIIATLTVQAVDKGIPVTIKSSDKDLMQLVCPTVKLSRPKNGGGYEECGIDYVIERFGVPPYQMGDLLALVGDATDNVPGAKGIGEKKAAHLLTKFGSLDGIIEHASEIPWPTIRARFPSEIESVRMSRELVRLRHDVPLPEPFPLWPFSPDKKALLNWLTSMEFASLANEVTETL